MSLEWSKVDEVLFATAISGRNGGRYQLIAEPLPDIDGWDWSVCAWVMAPATARHGDAPSAQAAIKATEAAAQIWDDTGAPGSFADS
jgi:hypothetical protein